VFTELEQLSKGGSRRHFVVNPVVGPEPITGSSRMKGGSVTKILLETMFYSGWKLLSFEEMDVVRAVE
jgi:N-acetylmuramic acid 6-phosphate (MurNAc-6-P) etherase